MRTTEEIRAEMEPLEVELRRIEDAKKKEEHRALLGKCYRYHNSYGSDRPRWWLYAKVTHIGEYWPRVFTFQTTCEDEIIIKSKDFISGIGRGGYEEIAATEFKKQWRAIVKRVSSIKP